MLDPMNPATLSAARESLGLSRLQLASMASVDETTIWRIETGKVDPRILGTWAPIVRAIQAEERL